jgi:cell division protein FtsB
MPAKSNSLVILVIGLALGFGFTYWVYPAIVYQINGTNTKTEELAKELQQLYTQVATLKAENQQLKQELVQAPSQEELRRLRDQVSQLNSRVSYLQSENEQLSQDNQELRAKIQELRMENDRLKSGVIPPPSASDPPHFGPYTGNAECISLLQQARPVGPNPRWIYTRPEFVELRFGGNWYFKIVCAAWFSSVSQINPVVVKCETSSSNAQCPTPRRGSEVWPSHPYNFLQIISIDGKYGEIRTLDQSYVCDNTGAGVGDTGWQWYCWNNGAFVGLRRVEK